MFCSPTETRVARKRHRCTSCGEWIEPGETYKRWASIETGDSPLTSKMHPECLEGHTQGAICGEFEYSLYDNDRPERKEL